MGSVSQNQIRCKLLQLWGHKKTVNEHFKQCEITSELFKPYWCEIACSCGNTNSMPIYIVRAKLHVICFFLHHMGVKLLAAEGTPTHCKITLYLC